MWEPGARVLDERFRIVDAGAQGGRTEVYVAEQLSLSRKVTLKVFHAAPGAQQLGDRFDEEVRRLARVDHPAVVRVIDSGRAEAMLVLVSELAEGRRLADELVGEPLLPERGLELLTQIANGLAAIHEQQLLHGELRPATVVLANGVAGEQVRLLDFGLARLVEPQSPEGATVIGPVIGPVEYLSPEQQAGASASVPSDLYAFGLLAYHVLSGALPSRPIAKPLAEAAPHLSDQTGLCETVLQCLEPDPTRRPGSARELAKKLAALPRPTEPTIFLETMQRPPPVPAGSSAAAASAPSAQGAPPPLPPATAAAAPSAAGSARAAAGLPPAAASAAAPAALGAPPPLPPAPAAAGSPALGGPAAPRPLLASVQTLIVSAPAPELVIPAAPPARKSRLPWAVAGGALLIAVAGGAIIYANGAVKREVRTLIERRQPVQALEIIGKTQRKLSAPDPQLLALKVAALHLSAGHADEASIFKALPAGTPEALDPLVLAGLVEDFAKKEDAALRALLGGLPRKELHRVLEAFAQEPLSPRQWGALRYLDLEQAAGALSLVPLYSASLESNDCSARKAAARRLGQLMDDSSEAALGRLRDAPREGAEKNCGQDEAQAALQALKKSR